MIKVKYEGVMYINTVELYSFIHTHIHSRPAPAASPVSPTPPQHKKREVSHHQLIFFPHLLKE